MLPDYRDIPVDLSAMGLPGRRLHVRVYEANKPEISGNKAFKLWYWLHDFPENARFLSFGGAFSNHLLALSAAAGNRSIGIVRGEKPARLNPWLKRMQNNGMSLHFVQRSAFSAFRDNPQLALEMAPDAVLIPEGGGGQKGIQGATLMARDLQSYDAVALPGGTGTTAAGLLLAEGARHCEIHCFQALKGEGYLQREISAWVGASAAKQLFVHDQFHFGGYARRSDQLLLFAQQWKQETGIALDEVYGAKAMFGLLQVMQANSPAKRWLYVHTGGLGLTPAIGG
jgi:1-aminocyclopropane-1-carboxylate deaminase